MDYIVNKITDYFLNQKYISKDRKEIYSYGFKLILSDIINFSIVLLCSIILKDIAGGIAFLITLCSIRQFSGGFHAKTFWLCRLTMILTFIAVVYSSVLINGLHIKLLLCALINVFSILVIAILAPIRHPNKTLTEQQRRKNKQKSIISSVLLSVISIVLSVMNVKIGVTISMTILTVVILMIIGLIRSEGGETNV